MPLNPREYPPPCPQARSGVSLRLFRSASLPVCQSAGLPVCQSQSASLLNLKVYRDHRPDFRMSQIFLHDFRVTKKLPQLFGAQTKTLKRLQTSFIFSQNGRPTNHHVATCLSLGPQRGHMGGPGGPRVVPRNDFGGIWVPFWSHLVPFWGYLVPFWRYLGPFFGSIRTPWGGISVPWGAIWYC